MCLNSLNFNTALTCGVSQREVGSVLSPADIQRLGSKQMPVGVGERRDDAQRRRGVGLGWLDRDRAAADAAHAPALRQAAVVAHAAVLVARI